MCSREISREVDESWQRRRLYKVRFKASKDWDEG
jgi:hypothetical protein